MKKKIIALFICTILCVVCMIYFLTSKEYPEFKDYQDNFEQGNEVQVIDDNTYWVDSDEVIDLISSYMEAKEITGIVTECVLTMDVDEPPTGDIVDFMHLGKYYHINIIGGDEVYIVISDGVVIEVNYY